MRSSTTFGGQDCGAAKLLQVNARRFILRKERAEGFILLLRHKFFKSAPTVCHGFWRKSAKRRRRECHAWHKTCFHFWRVFGRGIGGFAVLVAGVINP
jgi:hypothetical protein